MKGSRLREACENSAILGFFRRIVSGFYDLLLYGVFRRLRKRYPDAVKAVDGSAAAELFDLSSARNRALSRKLYKSPLSALAKALKRRLLSTTMRAYGTLFAMFGLFSSIYYALPLFRFAEVFALDTVSLGISLGVTILSLFFLIFPMPLHEAVTESRISSFFCFDLLGIARPSVEKADGGIPVFRALIYGILLGIPSVIFSPGATLLVLFAAVTALLILETPEFSVYLSLLFIPASPVVPYGSAVLAAIILLGGVAYIAKLLLGKRTFLLQPADILVALLVIVYLFGGIFSFGGTESLYTGILTAALASSYFLVSNLLQNERMCLRFARVLSLSMTVTAAVAIFQYFMGNADISLGEWIDTSVFPDITGRATAFFGNPNLLSAYLVMGIPVILSLFPTTTHFGHRFLSFIALSASVTALVLTFSRGAWIGLFIAVILFFLIYSRRSPIVILCIGILLPLLLYVLPDAVTVRFSSAVSAFLPSGILDSSASYRLSVWQGTLSAIGDFFLGGIGIGEAAFREIYPIYAVAGAEEAVHSHNLYLEIFLELGITGLVFFLLFFVLLFLDMISHRASSTQRDAARKLHVGAFCAVLAVMIHGFADHTLYSLPILCLFYMMAGFQAALGRRGRVLSLAYKGVQSDERFKAEIDIPTKR